MAEHQPKPLIQWPFYIEREDDFSGLTVGANILALFTFFIRRRFLVLLSVILFCVSLPSKKKSDLQIGSIFMSGIIVIISVLVAYGFFPANYD